MKSYLDLTHKYLNAHKKNIRLTMISIIISVALITTVFSMLDVFWKFEKQQVIDVNGNYHIIVNQITDEETQTIKNRIDVAIAAKFLEFDAEMNGNTVHVATVDENIEKLFTHDFSLLEGSLPQSDSDILVEKWVMEQYHYDIGDVIHLSSKVTATKYFRITGICQDFNDTKAEAIPGFLVSYDGAKTLAPDEPTLLIVQFKDQVNINKAESQIKETLGISDQRIGHNERLLAMMLQSRSNMVIGLYATGAILFLLVLIAGVTMIYNTFNISVMDRVRQFGLLRCIGASRNQIVRLVKKEGRIIALKAIPIGILIGIFLTFICSAILKYYNSSFFSDIPLLNFSLPGIISGAVIGMLTVLMASLVPAKRAARVSPLNAVNANYQMKYQKKAKGSILTRLLHADTALGLRNALTKKKTLILMSTSIAISIILFLGFQVFIDVMYAGIKTVKPYTPDISIVSENGFGQDLYDELANLDGCKYVYGRMFSHTDITFDASKLTDTYINEIGGIQTDSQGILTPKEQSWLISYDQMQLKWAKTDLLEGTLSEDKLNNENGIIAVKITTRKGVAMETTDLQLGDKVYIDTISGKKEFTVMAVLRSIPFNDDNLNMTAFITTEKQFTEITGDTTLDIIDIQLNRGNQEETIASVRKIIGDDVKFMDARQKNSETSQVFITVALFVYGFVLVIALISILNIINTMQTSISAKTRYLGVMRAVGMSGKQLRKMIIAEAATYAVCGSLSGIILGIILQNQLVTKLLTDFHIKWQFPTLGVIIIFLITILATLLSIIGPLKRINAGSITETIGTL